MSDDSQYEGSATQESAMNALERLQKNLLEGVGEIKVTLEHLRWELVEQHQRQLNYAHLIMFGGYASYFGLWAMAKPFVSPFVAALSALLMLASIAIFVGHQVIRIFVDGYALRQFNKILDWEDIDDNKAGFELMKQRFNQRKDRLRRSAVFDSKIWPSVFIIGALTALIAASLLAYALVQALFMDLATYGVGITPPPG